MKKLCTIAIALSAITALHANKPQFKIPPVEREGSGSSTCSAGSSNTPRVNGSVHTPRMTLRGALDNGTAQELGAFLTQDAYWPDSKVPVPGRGMLCIHDYVAEKVDDSNKIALLIKLSPQYALQYLKSIVRLNNVARLQQFLQCAAETDLVFVLRLAAHYGSLEIIKDMFYRNGLELILADKKRPDGTNAYEYALAAGCGHVSAFLCGLYVGGPEGQPVLNGKSLLPVKVEKA